MRHLDFTAWMCLIGVLAQTLTGWSDEEKWWKATSTAFTSDCSIEICLFSVYTPTYISSPFRSLNKIFFLPPLSCTVDFSCFQCSNFSQHWLHPSVWTLEVASFFSGLQLTPTTQLVRSPPTFPLHFHFSFSQCCTSHATSTTTTVSNGRVSVFSFRLRHWAESQP